MKRHYINLAPLKIDYVNFCVGKKTYEKTLYKFSALKNRLRQFLRR